MKNTNQKCPQVGPLLHADQREGFLQLRQLPAGPGEEGGRRHLLQGGSQVTAGGGEQN